MAGCCNKPSRCGGGGGGDDDDDEEEEEEEEEEDDKEKCTVTEKTDELTGQYSRHIFVLSVGCLVYAALCCVC